MLRIFLEFLFLYKLTLKIPEACIKKYVDTLKPIGAMFILKKVREVRREILLCITGGNTAFLNLEEDIYQLSADPT